MSDARTLILVVDDVLAVRRVASDWLKHDGYEVVEAGDFYDAVQAVHEIKDLRMVLTDLQIQNGTARDLHHQIGAVIQERNGLFVVLTGARFDEPHLRSYGEYFTEHAIRVFHKPIRWQAELLPFLGTFRDRPVG